MAELKDVLGAVLKDMAHARVISDQFSSEISREYLKDPLLGIFPVPRAEIREASINVKFAVNAVVSRPVDLTGVARTLATRHSAGLAATVFRDFIRKHPQAEEILKVIEAKGLDLENRLRAAAARAILEDPQALEAARRGEPGSLAKRISTEVSAALLEDADLKRLLASRGFRVGTIRGTVQEMAGAAASRFGDELAAAAAAAEKQALLIDVGVTRKELADTPEPLISQISLVAQIRNYEWVEVGEEDGKPRKRLQPE
jgi:hypothetical protein